MDLLSRPGYWQGVRGAQIHLSGIGGLIDATRRGHAVIGVDSGPMHLAAALSKPGVAIFGPTDPASHGPYGGSLRVLRSPDAVTSYKRREEIDESMRAITPGMVLEALEGALRNVRCRQGDIAWSGSRGSISWYGSWGYISWYGSWSSLGVSFPKPYAQTP